MNIPNPFLLVDRLFNLASEATARARSVVDSNVRLDNENTALRRELSVSRNTARAFGRDLYALSRGFAAETEGGAAVDRRINRLNAELEAMRPVFAPIGDHAVSEVITAIRKHTLDLSHRACMRNLAERFEAYEKIHAGDGGSDGSARALEDAAAVPAVPASPSPRVIYDTGVDKWEFGQAMGSTDKLLGPCPKCGARTLNTGMSWRCRNIRCDTASAALPGPFWWGTDITVKIDESVWAALRADKPDTKIGYGTTPAFAVANLLGIEYGQNFPPLSTTLP